MQKYAEKNLKKSLLNVIYSRQLKITFNKIILVIMLMFIFKQNIFNTYIAYIKY